MTAMHTVSLSGIVNFHSDIFFLLGDTDKLKCFKTNTLNSEYILIKYGDDILIETGFLRPILILIFES